MRKASKTDYGYNSTFPCRLRKIMDDNKTTQATLANECGVERQSVAQWRDGNTRPDILSLKKIAEFYNVSTDYLLGLSNAPTRDIELKAICEYTGLSQNAIEKIVQIKGLDAEMGADDLCNTLSLIIENENFWDIHCSLLVAKDDKEFLLPNHKYFAERAKNVTAGTFKNNPYERVMETIALTGLAPVYQAKLFQNVIKLFNEVIAYEKS